MPAQMLDTARGNRYPQPCMSLESVRLITFDCYGTLIDWETGLLQALRPLFAAAGRAIPDVELLELYGEIEAELETAPYLPYRDVMARTAQAMGQRLGTTISADDGDAFADSLAGWEPFPDTVAALQSLSRKFTLGIISNVDDDSFAKTQKKLQVSFAVIVTAEQVQSYKPALKNFQEMLRRSGLPKEEVLHAGQSVYHDIVPTTILGIKNVWVNRPSIRPGVGAVRRASSQPVYEVHSLAELAGFLETEGGPGQATI